MQSAATYLHIVRERGRRGLPLDRVYRQLFNPELYLHAYGKIATNRGALTPGATDETADGMTLATIERIIALLRDERYRWTPARRVYIAKRGTTKRRPLGLPTWSDKLVQEVIRPRFARRAPLDAAAVAVHEHVQLRQDDRVRHGRVAHSAPGQPVELSQQGCGRILADDVADL